MNSGDPKLDQFVLSSGTEVCLLDCKDAFNALTLKEKRYSHHLSQASWKGALICLYQCSAESPGIFLLLQYLFNSQTIEEIETLARQLGFTDEDVQAFFIYCAGFYSSFGNYKSFGDTKFIPDVSKDKINLLITSSTAYQKPVVATIWNQVKDLMFSLPSNEQQLGLDGKGVSTYFSSNCTMADAQFAQEFMDSKNIIAYNTRLFKSGSGDETVFEIRQASEVESELTELSGNFTGANGNKAMFKVTRGDYYSIMRLMNRHLEKTKEFVANELEESMLTKYIESFKCGSIPAHKDGSRHWIRNAGPIVENYIGFIESYRDPFGTRGEFEGFVAIVNKAMSAKFGRLVANAENLLPLLPWPKDYEKDKFLKPDFTSLDVLAFASSGIPAGINIPNYDDIRQSEGFKNVSLGNVLSAQYKDSKITFLKEKDKDLYKEYKILAFEVQVGLHELLGHGSGKLFIQDKNGDFNFDKNSVRHTESNELIDKWYHPGETWDSKFSTIASTYEECRAECIGIYFSLFPEVLKIFGHEGEVAEDILYINWLNMVRSGLLALEYYTPETKTWRQAHMQARFVILQVLLEAGQDLVSIQTLTGEDGKPDALIELERNKIGVVGRKAIESFLRKLQVYKSTADLEMGKAMYCSYSAVHDDGLIKFLSLRDIVLSRHQPRKFFVQCNTKEDGDDVKLQAYESTAKGLIQSNIDRYCLSELGQPLQELWDREFRCHVSEY